MITATDAEKAFDKTQHSFTTTLSVETGVERNFPNLIKPTADIILNGEKRKAFPLRSGKAVLGVASLLVTPFRREILASSSFLTPELVPA